MPLPALDPTDLLIPLGLSALAYVILLWMALTFWIARDARMRSPSRLFATVAVLLGLVLPLIGALLYLVVRPPHTLDEERALVLEEQALLNPPSDEAAQPRPCPSCGREIEPDFVVCPYCRTRFARRCTHCQRWLRLGWRVCPYCGEDVGVYDFGAAGRAAGS